MSAPISPHPLQIQELCWNIFRFLDLPKDCITISKVCKFWRNSIRKIEFLYFYLNHCEFINDALLSKIQNAFKNLHQTDYSRVEILKCCRHLWKLDLKRSTSMDSLEEYSSSACSVDASYNHNLRFFPLKGFSNLIQLDLSYTLIQDEFFQTQGIERIQWMKMEGCCGLENPKVSNCTNLKFLNLKKCRSLKNPFFDNPSLIKLCLQQCYLLKKPKMNNLISLKDLDLSSNNLVGKELGYFLKQNIPMLENLSLGCLKVIDKAEISFPSLKELDMSACFNLETLNIEKLAQLESLLLVGTKIDDHTISHLSQTLTSLKKLNASHCCKLRNIKFEHLNLESITLDWCHQLSSISLNSMMRLKELSIKNHSGKLSLKIHDTPNLENIDVSITRA